MEVLPSSTCEVPWILASWTKKEHCGRGFYGPNLKVMSNFLFLDYNIVLWLLLHAKETGGCSLSVCPGRSRKYVSSVPATAFDVSFLNSERCFDLAISLLVSSWETLQCPVYIQLDTQFIFVEWISEFNKPV